MYSLSNIVLILCQVVCDYLRSAPLGFRINSDEEGDTADMSEREQVQCVLHRIICAVSADGNTEQRTPGTSKNTFCFPLVTRPFETSDNKGSNNTKNDDSSKSKLMKRIENNRGKKSYATLDDDGGDRVLESINKESGSKTPAPSICDSSSVTSSKRPKIRKNADTSPKPIFRVVTDDAPSPPVYEDELAVGHCGDRSVLRNIVTDDGDNLIMWTIDEELNDAMDVDDGFVLHIDDADSPPDAQNRTFSVCEYRDPRYCIFCRMPEASTSSRECVRMLQYPDGAYAHLNCVLCASGVIESDGALEGALLARTK